MPLQPTRRPSPKSSPRKNTKLTGERSEAAFLNRAASLGFGVAKPWGDSLRYDFILDNGSRLWRVQVKCTESIRARAYETRATYTTGKGRAVYTRADVDFLAAHIVPLDIWYIIPVEVCTPAPMLRFYPHREAKLMRLEKYREAWPLLQSQDDGEKDDGEKIDNARKPRYGLEIHAMADEAIYPEIVPVTVIPSEGTDSQSESAPQSRDLGCASPDDAACLSWLTPRPNRPVIIPPPTDLSS